MYPQSCIINVITGTLASMTSLLGSVSTLSAQYSPCSRFQLGFWHPGVEHIQLGVSPTVYDQAAGLRRDIVCCNIPLALDSSSASDSQGWRWRCDHFQGMSAHLH